jgi:sugar phosphate isomerase/epimerase
MKHNNNLRTGIVQGRLIRPPVEELQWFPQEYWEVEFFIARTIGINYIELIAERNYNSHNPIWSDTGIEKIKELVKRNDLSMYAFCNDYIIDHALVSDLEVLEQNIRLLERGKLLGCKKLILPLFENSELNLDNSDNYIEILRTIANIAGECGIQVCLETILDGNQIITFLDKLNHHNVAVVYDTGNRIAFGHDLAGDIRLLGKNRIAHVHIKDKNSQNKNVLLGTGLVNFQSVFEALFDINYEGTYTFETQRGSDPIRTALYNIEVINFFYGEALSR